MIIEGQQLGSGRYRLLHLISRSSSSEIYLAEDTQLSRQVAVKAVLSENSVYASVDATQLGSRFLLRETEIIMQFNHPHILALLGYGEEFVNANMLTYWVMPFCPEGSLAAWLKQRHSLLSPQDVVELLQQAAAALSYAHSKQIIHLNVKPSNFLIRRNTGHTSLPHLLLTNFRIITYNAASFNGSQFPYGTPLSMAPEQWNGHPVPATDQYALAIMAYELLTGRYPFVGTPEQLKHQHLNEQPQQPSRLNPVLTQDVDRVILLALAKKPEDRFKSISAFARAFEQAISVSPLPGAVNLPSQQRDEDIAASAPPSTPQLFTQPAVASQPKPSETTESRSPQLSRFKASVIVYAVLTVGFGLCAGIALNAFGKLPSQIAYIASGVGGLIVLLAGIFGSVLKGSILEGTRRTWQSANRPFAVGGSLLTIGLLTALMIVVPFLSSDPYTHDGYGNSTLVLDDPLRDNSQGYNWEVGDNDRGRCAFVDRTYHVQAKTPNQIIDCPAQATNFSNFVFEVQMTIVSGDCGGIIFRFNQAQSQEYFFEICPRGYYYLIRYNGGTGSGSGTAKGFTILARDRVPSIIHTGLNQPNLLAVVASARGIDLWVNRQPLASVPDSTYKEGQIALVAVGLSLPTEVVFSNAKVWTF